MTTLMCLAAAIYFEARGEPELGQLGVAEVVINRTERPEFPDDVCDVVNQKSDGACQFSYVCSEKELRIKDEEAYLKALMLAAVALYMPYREPVVEDAIYFHTTDVNPRWSRRMDEVAVIGNHVFLADRL